VTRGSTYENRENLAPGFFGRIIRKYEAAGWAGKSSTQSCSRTRLERSGTTA